VLSNVDLAKENEALKKRVLELEAENINNVGLIKDSADVVELMKDEKIQLERQAKEPLIKALVKDSEGCFNEADLDKLSLDALQTLRLNFESEVARAYMDFLDNREQRDKARKQKAQSAMGTFNPETGTYEGGIVV